MVAVCQSLRRLRLKASRSVSKFQTSNAKWLCSKPLECEKLKDTFITSSELQQAVNDHPLTSTLTSKGVTTHFNAMPAAKRARACDTCHSIKIKCELGSSGGDPPCERCTRLGKKCIISPPIRQKDRVAELEAKIEALTRLLEAQDIQVPSPSVNAGTPASSRGGVSESIPATPLSSFTAETSKKRRLEGSSQNFNRASNGIGDSLASDGRSLELDAVIPSTVQMQVLDRYRKEIQPRLSLASLMEKGDYEYLRSTYPILLQAVIYAASLGFVSMDVQEDISKVVKSTYTSSTTQ